MNRIPKAGQLWSHYKHPDKLYEIKGVNVATREPVVELLYFAKKEDTLEDLAVYHTAKDNLKLYYVKLTKEREFEKLLKVITEPHVIYQSKVDGVVWARPYDDFVEIISLEEGTDFYRFVRVE
jgi:hypothetical protein